MTETFWSTLVIAVSSIICQILINKNNRKKQSEEDAEKEKKKAVEQAVKDEHLENRLRSIEQKLDAHNGYADKIGGIRDDMNKIAIDVAVIKTDLQSLKEN